MTFTAINISKESDLFISRKGVSGGQMSPQANGLSFTPSHPHCNLARAHVWVRLATWMLALLHLSLY